MASNLFLLIFSVMASGSNDFSNVPKTIQLFPGLSDMAYLEDIGKVESHCGTVIVGPVEVIRKVKECYKRYVKPLTRKIDLYESADFKSKIVGHIEVTSGPEMHFKATYRYGDKTGVYEPDSEGDDSGYDGYFLYTVAKESGDWIQLPKRPFDRPVWINLVHVWGKKWAPKPAWVSPGNIYRSSLGSIIIQEFKGSKFKYREENAADMNCTDEEIDRSSLSFEVEEADIKELYDSDGHLTIRHKYPRGC